MKNKLNLQVENNYKFKYLKEFKKIINIFAHEFNYSRKISVDLLLIDNLKMKTINQETRNINKTTDILSFPLNNFISLPEMKYQPLGEIIISYDKIISQAIEFNHSEKREFCYMFIHGLVHLSGRDHKKNKSEEIEFNNHVNNIINILGINR